MNVGDRVSKKSGYGFPGVIVAKFFTTTGNLRFVVEMDEFHLLHIFNEEQLVLSE